jgi:hypothetical protein
MTSVFKVLGFVLDCRKGVEGRWLFHSNTAGKVDKLIDRRNNEDVVWTK